MSVAMKGTTCARAAEDNSATVNRNENMKGRIVSLRVGEIEHHRTREPEWRWDVVEKTL